MSTIIIERDFQDFFISSDKAKIDVETVYQFLDKESYWSKGIPFETVRTSIEHSICLGAYLSNGVQVGFGRMITDRATFGYLADIFVTKPYRGKGISKRMMELFCELADQFGLRRFLLTTQDAHSLYQQFDFDPFPYPERLMSRPGVIYNQ